MPLATGYTPSRDSHRWNERAEREVRGTGGVTHAEVAVFSAMQARPGPHLIVQDAFPFHKCDRYFLQQSQRDVIIVKVTEDRGGYAADHPERPADLSYPIFIWYRNGVKTISTQPPDGFPVHPSCDRL